MAYGNTDKQQRYRQRPSARGRVHVQGWVTPEQAEVIRRIMAERGGDAPAEEQRGGRRGPVQSRNLSECAG